MHGRNGGFADLNASDARTLDLECEIRRVLAFFFLTAREASVLARPIPWLTAP